MNNIDPIQRKSTLPDLQPTGGSQIDDDEFDLVELFRTLWRGKWWIAACMAVAVALAGYWAFFVAVPLYSTTAHVTLENRQSQVVDFESVVSGLSGDQTSINTEVEVLKSRELAKKLVLELDLVNDPEFNPDLREDSSFAPLALLRKLIHPSDSAESKSPEQVTEEVTTNVLEAFSISNIRNTYVFEIEATTEDPAKSKLFADTLAELYILNQLDVKFEATQRATKWLSDRVATLQVELEEAEARVKEFNSQTELISPEVLEALNRQAKDTRERLKSTSERAAESAARIEAMEAAEAVSDRQSLAQASGNPALIQALARVEAGTMEEAAFDKLAKQIIQAEASTFARAQNQVQGLNQSLINIEAQIDRQSKDLVTLQQLTREAEAARSIYEYFLGRLKETSVQQGIQQADSRVLSKAVLPTIPSAPKKTRIVALAGILGLMLGAGLVLLREFLNNSFRTPQQLEQSTGITVMGQIPRMPVKQRKDAIRYLHEKPTSAAAEAIRNLRTSVMLSNVDQPPQVIMLTSSIPGEGKTTLTLALAQSFAGLGKRVLLIEGDLRRLVFSEYFSKEDYKHGLISVLAGDTNLSDASLRIPEIGADVLLGEKFDANVADLFSSERFSKMINEARDAYDVVLIDTAPVLVVPDARTIAQHADALLFAVHWDSTSQAQVAEGLRMLESVNFRPSGLVLSQIDTKGMKRYGYDGQYGAYAQYGRKYYSN
ncbi:capsular exopolysaccharide family [Ruegeria intermedia]|uniref:non-specific protein-tyrosine kinase n=1 Tax=Ruegeria intermedia TaxID=996115 RepID=A0A1M5B3V2_9RHOB|nr:polysaccharide biosynthesis tyrosine autokinase [Ruegeria intermedia]SHF37173.1 capsular exopolysaccharide family [Ruegeria intermedia]